MQTLFQSDEYIFFAPFNLLHVTSAEQLAAFVLRRRLIHWWKDFWKQGFAAFCFTSMFEWLRTDSGEEGTACERFSAQVANTRFWLKRRFLPESWRTDSSSFSEMLFVCVATSDVGSEKFNGISFVHKSPRVQTLSCAGFLFSFLNFAMLIWKCNRIIIVTFDFAVQIQIWFNLIKSLQIFILLPQHESI